jgi:hypothetical protein
MNENIALLLYGAAVIGVELSAHDQMMNQLLRSQNQGGGIATLTHGNGIPGGSANAKTTAVFLLNFNTKLIAHLNGGTIPILMPEIEDLSVTIPRIFFGRVRRVLLGEEESSNQPLQRIEPE